MFPSKKNLRYFRAYASSTERKAVSFDSFFDSYSKQEIVTTFMALLELMKTGAIYAEQENNIVKFCYLIQKPSRKIQQRWRKHSDIS